MQRPRSKFDRSHQLLTTINEGELVPIYCDEVLPGDTARVRLNGLIRMSTPIYPIMDNCYMDTYFFFVPCRLLWEHWENMFGENDTNYWAEKTEYSTPMCKIGGGDGDTGIANGTIGDYFGLPTNVNKEIKVNALPARAYAMIYNEWFRDENVEAPLMVGYKKNDTGGTEKNAAYIATRYANQKEYTTENNEANLYCIKPAKAGKFHDYFTSCLPSPLKSDPVEISLTGDAPVIMGNYNEVTGKVDAFSMDTDIWFNGKGAGAGRAFNRYYQSAQPGYPAVELTGVDTNGATTDSAGNNIETGNLYANLNNVTAISIQDLRMAIALQHIFEADARNGTRYREFLSGTWGVTSPDSRLQIPEYIGGQRIAINVNQVVQTSQTDTKTGQALGNTAAYSLTTCSKQMVDYAATEYGFIIGLAVVRVEHSYQQGLATKWTRGGRFTYYDPRLAALGEQPVYNREIYAQGTAEDDEIFGYQEAWADYRYKPSYVTGEMRSNFQTSLDAWHYADNYNKLPRLSAEWIQEGTQNIDRTIAVTSNVSHQFLCDFYFNEDWYREMPIYSIPGIERI